jgi:hypothetical protein
MKTWISLIALTLATLSGVAQAADCEAQAAEKKLAGAAKNSFAGGAKNSFVKKCVADAAK